jgi:hypothetical protein
MIPALLLIQMKTNHTRPCLGELALAGQCATTPVVSLCCAQNRPLHQLATCKSSNHKSVPLPVLHTSEANRHRQGSRGALAAVICSTIGGAGTGGGVRAAHDMLHPPCTCSPARSTLRELPGMPCDASRREAVERDVPRRVATLLLHVASEGTGTARACRLIGRGSRVGRRHLLLEQDLMAELLARG